MASCAPAKLPMPAMPTKKRTPTPGPVGNPYSKSNQATHAPRLVKSLEAFLRRVQALDKLDLPRVIDCVASNPEDQVEALCFREFRLHSSGDDVCYGCCELTVFVFHN